MGAINSKREEIVFHANTPVILSLAYPDGKEIPSKFEGQKRFMFSTTDNKTFFCNEQLRNILVGLKIKKGELIQICRRETRVKSETRPRAEWQIYRVDADGKIITRPAAVVPPPAHQAQQPTSTGESKTTAAQGNHPQNSSTSEGNKSMSGETTSPPTSKSSPPSAHAASKQTDFSQHRVNLLKRLNQDMSSALKIALSSVHSAEEYAQEHGLIGDNGAPLRFCNQSIQKIAASVFIELSIRTRNSIY